MSLSQVQPQTYECPRHKIQHYGYYRPNFDKELYDFIVNSPMDLTYRLYREIIHNCHCPFNYEKYDAIIKAILEHPKETAMDTD